MQVYNRIPSEGIHHTSNNVHAFKQDTGSSFHFSQTTKTDIKSRSIINHVSRFFTPTPFHQTSSTHIDISFQTWNELQHF